MPWIYILKGSSGRHYIGSAVDLNARLAQHRRGHTYTTKRLGENLELVASKEVATLDEARKIERTLKAKESAACHSRVTTVEQPRKLSRARDSCRSCGLIELLAQACSNE